jgi:peptidoglycan/xylan/chitin deacetylase (PgdA/CDA1 family)
MIASRRLRDRVNGLTRRTFSPLPLNFWERAFPKDLIALCYHMVSDEDLQHFALYPYKTAAQFEADVRYARSRAVRYRDVVASRTGGTPLPLNSVLFTFDDGMAECFGVIRPILQRHGVDGVFFVTTDYLDERKPFLECTISRCLSAAAAAPLDTVRSALAQVAIEDMPASDSERSITALKRLQSVRLPRGQPERRKLFLWLLGLREQDRVEIDRACDLLGIDGMARTKYFMSREEVGALAADGFTVGAHGLTHRSLEGLETREIEREVVASCEAVREITGQARVPFAFPYSGLAVDRAAIGEIVRRNPLVELVFDSGCLRRDPSFIVNRVFVDTPASAAASNLSATLRQAWSIPSAWFRAAGSAALEA